MSYPTTPVPNSISITSLNPTFTSVTHSLKRQVRTRGGQRWQIDATFPPLTRTDFAPVWAFAQKQKGQFGTFSFTPPIYSNSSGSASGTLRVNNSAGYIAGTSTLTVDGLTGTLKAGDFIKFSSHNKVYMIVADVTSSSNAATVTIEPPLTTALGDDNGISYDSVTFTVALTNDIQEIQLQNTGLFQYEIDMIEVI